MTVWREVTHQWMLDISRHQNEGSKTNMSRKSSKTIYMFNIKMFYLNFAKSHFFRLNSILWNIVLVFCCFLHSFVKCLVSQVQGGVVSWFFSSTSFCPSLFMCFCFVCVCMCFFFAVFYLKKTALKRDPPPKYNRLNAHAGRYDLCLVYAQS